MANKDTILTIYDSDIISESMHKINYNFELLLNKDDVSDWKLSKLEQKINNELENIRRTSDERAGGLSRELDDLQELLEGLHSHEEIQAMVDSAIRNAESSLRSFITSMAGEQISEMVGGFAKTADISRLQGLIDGLNGRVDGLENSSGSGDDREYVSSEAFTQYKSDAANRQAEANMMAANSTFKKNDAGYYILWDPDNPDSDVPSVYKSLADFYRANINEIDPDRLGLSDPDVYKRFLAACERTFKSVFTELAQVRAYVEDGAAGFDIMAAINKDGHDIAAAIIGYVNEDGSNITISANHVEIDTDKFVVYGDDIIMDANHRLALLANGFTINSDNLIVDLNGNVQMTGDLYAKTLRTNSGNTEIDSDGKLTTKSANIEGDLTADTLRTNSGNTEIDANGNLTTINANITGDLTATTLTAAFGKTTIDTNGVLHATGAEISGDITAQQFLATDIVDINAATGGYTGTITKTTIINGSSFNISADGTLTKNVDENTTLVRTVTGNQLYIKIADEIKNTGNDDIPDTWMYGVPTLYMRYIDSNGEPHEYLLDPNIWKKVGATSDDTSDMRWLRQYNTTVLKYTPNQYALDATSTYKHYKGTLGSTSPLYGTFYIFDPDNRNYLISGISGSNANDEVYRLYVYDLGSTEAAKTSNLNSLKTNELVLNNNSVDASNLNNYAAYALKSKIDSNLGTSYCGPSASQTKIQDVITEYPKYLQDIISCGVKLHFTHEFYSLTNLYGVQHMYDFMVYALGGVKNDYNDVVNNQWKMTGDVTGLSYAVPAEFTTAYQGLVNNLPFSEGGYYTSGNNYIEDPEFEVTITAYPMINITDKGKSVGEYTKCIYGTYSAELRCHRYVDNDNRAGSNNSYTMPIQYQFEKYDTETHMYQRYTGEFIPEYIGANIQFDFMFVLSSNGGDGIAFDPLNAKARSTNDDGEDNIMNKIYTFLKTFDFITNIKNKKDQSASSNTYPDHVKFSSTIVGRTKSQRQYGGYDLKSATFTKTMIL